MKMKTEIKSQQATHSKRISSANSLILFFPLIQPIIKEDVIKSIYSLCIKNTHLKFQTQQRDRHRRYPLSPFKNILC